MNEYGGHWIETYTGKKFHFLDPQSEEIDIIDIAHHLSLTCRFAGACREFYSVAEHSIRVAEIVPDKYKLHALLHDASEAYLPDLPRPMKASLPEFKKMEHLISIRILDKLVFPILNQGFDVKVVKEADNTLLATEARDLMANMDDWAKSPLPLPDKIVPLSSQDAEKLFLQKFEELSRE